MSHTTRCRKEAAELSSVSWTKRQIADLVQKERPRGSRLKFLIKHMVSQRDFTHLCSAKNFGQAVYTYLGGEKQKCPCGKHARFLNAYDGYSAFCGESCSRSSGSGHSRPHRVYPKELEQIFVKRVKDARGLRFFHRVRNSRYWPDVVRYKKQFGLDTKQILYHMFVDSKVGKCLECGDPTRIGSTTSYNKFCCSDCGAKASKRLWSSDPKRVARFLRRKEATDLERYGAKHHWLNPEIKQRAIINAAVSLSKKKTIVIQGKTYSYRGYEKFAIRDLVARGCEVVTDPRELPIVHYHFGRHRRYLPDIKVGNTLYEVKSDYTMGLYKRSTLQFDLLVAKAAAVRAAGYKFVCLVYGKTGNLIMKTQLKSVNNRSRKRCQELMVRGGLNPNRYR